MITMTYAEARAISRNKELVSSLIEAKLSLPVAYNLRKILDKVGQSTQAFDLFELNTQKDIADRLATKNEKGEFVTELPAGKTEDSDRIVQFTDENKGIAMKELFHKVTAFGRSTFEIDKDKVDLTDENVQLRMTDLPMLELFATALAKDLGPVPA